MRALYDRIFVDFGVISGPVLCQFEGFKILKNGFIFKLVSRSFFIDF